MKKIILIILLLIIMLPIVIADYTTNKRWEYKFNGDLTDELGTWDLTNRNGAPFVASQPGLGQALQTSHISTQCAYGPIAMFPNVENQNWSIGFYAKKTPQWSGTATHFMGDSTAGNPGFWFDTLFGNSIRWNDGSNTFYYNEPGATWFNDWTHVVLTYNDINFIGKVYIDGEYKYQQNTNFQFNLDSFYWGIGCEMQNSAFTRGSSYYFDEMIMWNKELTLTDVEDLYDYYDSIICQPAWICTEYEACTTIGADLNCISVIDNNICGVAYSGNYSEFGTIVCEGGYSGVHNPINITEHIVKPIIEEKKSEVKILSIEGYINKFINWIKGWF